MRTKKDYRETGGKAAKDGVSKEERRRDAVAATVFVLALIAGVFAACCIVEAVCNAFTGGGFTFMMPAILTAGTVLAILVIAFLNGADDGE